MVKNRISSTTEGFWTHSLRSVLFGFPRQIPVQTQVQLFLFCETPSGSPRRSQTRDIHAAFLAHLAGRSVEEIGNEIMRVDCFWMSGRVWVDGFTRYGRYVQWALCAEESGECRGTGQTCCANKGDESWRRHYGSETVFGMR